jgi:Flp pilus assembly protein TadD
LASDLAQQGDFSQAAAEYETALLANPANVKIKLGLASVLLQLGKRPQALQQLNEALELEPDNSTLRESLRKLRGF